MKRILVITINKKWIISISGILFCFLAVITVYSQYLNKHTAVFSNGDTNSILELEKENDKLKSIFYSLVPAGNKIIVEDEYRNIYTHTGIAPPPPLTELNISKIISEGSAVNFKIISDDPGYIRPVYNPNWRNFYFRNWIYLPKKIIEARHRIFALALGGSSNFDITGSLSFTSKINQLIDNHHNINFIIYGFVVKSVKVLGNQVVLLGEPKRTGAQMVSIVQNDLLPEGVDTKDFVFQLSTEKGYEVDFLYQNIIRYEYLMKQIEEHTVHSDFTDETSSKSLEVLLKENVALKQELSYFIPIEDKIIPQQICDSLSNNQGVSDISAVIKQGKKVSFIINYKNQMYKRPIYDPLWKVNYKKKWCYIPNQIDSNMHRLHIIPQDINAQYNFFGALGFHEKYKPLKSGQYGFLIYNFDVSEVVINNDQLLLIGIPKRSGAELLSIDSFNIKNKEQYVVKLITPDYHELDCKNLLK